MQCVAPSFLLPRITNSENVLKNINEKIDIMARYNTGRRVRQTGQNMQRVPKAYSSVSKMFIYTVYIFVRIVRQCIIASSMYIK